jgi:hypothetical protein
MQNSNQANLQDLKKCTVAIQEPKNNKVLGTGVIVTYDGLIVTCYHVVGNIKKKIIDYKTVDIYFPAISGSKGNANVIEEYCHPSLDIALLQLEQKLPTETTITELGEIIHYEHKFQSFGFRKANVFQGLYAAGQIRGRVNSKVKEDDLSSKSLIQLSSSEIEPGMSGAPVLDLETNRVIGIIYEYWRIADKDSNDRNLSFAIPVEYIIKVCTEIKSKNPGLIERLPPLSVSVSPSIATYYDEIKDVANEDVEFPTSKIINSQNPEIQSSAWSDLEVFARNTRIWKHSEVWKVLDRAILQNVTGDFVNDALFILKGMLFNSKRDHTDEVILYVKKFYMKKLEELLSSWDSRLLKSKPDVKQIIEYITEKDESFNLLWRAWKRCAIEIKDDQEYMRAINTFITDLEEADPKYKYSIRRELYEFIDSSDSRIAKRAKDMHSCLYG